MSARREGMKTCPDCGCRVYEYGCVNCHEADYIEMQEEHDDILPRYEPKESPLPNGRLGPAMTRVEQAGEDGE